MTPRRIVINFKNTIRDLQAHHGQMVAAIGVARNRRTLEGILAEQFALELGIRWEGFVNDLFVAYLLHGKRSFLRMKQATIKEGILEKFGRPWGRLVVVRKPKRWTVRTVQALMDPRRRNITFDSADALFRQAGEILGSKAIRFSLTEHDRRLLNFLIALRNHLAHRSKASRRILAANVRQFNTPGPNRGLAGNIANLRGYLTSPDGTGMPRVMRVYARMSEMADSLG